MAEEYWIGWLIDNLGHKNDEVFAHLEQAIHNRNIPMYGNRGKEDSVSVTTSNVDMWWRRDTKQLTVTSEMDGTVVAKVITQDYGTSLWASVLLERDERDNWAKSMAWAAFQITLKGVVRDAIAEVAGGNAIIDVADPRKGDV